MARILWKIHEFTIQGERLNNNNAEFSMSTRKEMRERKVEIYCLNLTLLICLWSIYYTHFTLFLPPYNSHHHHRTSSQARKRLQSLRQGQTMHERNNTCRARKKYSSVIGQWLYRLRNKWLSLSWKWRREMTFIAHYSSIWSMLAASRSFLFFFVNSTPTFSCLLPLSPTQVFDYFAVTDESVCVMMCHDGDEVAVRRWFLFL